MLSTDSRSASDVPFHALLSSLCPPFRPASFAEDAERHKTPTSARERKPKGVSYVAVCARGSLGCFVCTHPAGNFQQTETGKPTDLENKRNKRHADPFVVRFLHRGKTSIASERTAQTSQYNRYTPMKKSDSQQRPFSNDQHQPTAERQYPTPTALRPPPCLHTTPRCLYASRGKKSYFLTAPLA